MGTVLRTLAGDIAPDGVVGILPHEHITVDLAPLSAGGNRRPRRSDVWDDLRGKLRALADAGVDTLVECTPPYLGRDVALMRDLGAAAGIRVLTPTGLYREDWQPVDLHGADPDSLADWMARDLSEAFSDETGQHARAGFIKLGCSNEVVRPAERNAIRAGARASRRTGATIVCHSPVGSRALEVLQMVVAEGAAPERLIVAHADSEPDLALIVEVARRGAWVEFDHIGARPDADEVHRIRHLAAAGLLDRVLLSQDVCGHIAGRGGDGRAYTYLHTGFAAVLRTSGFTDHDVRQILRDNPVRAFQMPAG
ncbi:MAG: esterase [Actinobacteria bacterium]|nr:esterase [Actinomycetota bacterium]